MKKLQIFMMLTMISILQNQQTFTAAENVMDVEKVEITPEASPAAVIAEDIAPVVEVPVVEAPVAEVAQVAPTVATPIVAAPAVQPIAAPIKIAPLAQTPAEKDYAEATVAFKKIGAVGYNVLQRTAQDVHAVILKAIEIVKDMSHDVSRSIRQFIAEKSEKKDGDTKDGDKPEDKVVTQTYRSYERQNYRQNKNNDNEQTISWIPEYAYEQTATGEVPYVAGYEEITN